MKKAANGNELLYQCCMNCPCLVQWLIKINKRKKRSNDLGTWVSGIRVGEIAEKAHLTRPSVSHHLKILKESGIVAMRKEGTKNFYYLSVNGTQWKEIADLIGLIYESIQQISSQS